jgi:hypothetical protein
MQRHQPFLLFQDAPDGPLWRASFADLEDAKRNARLLADEEREECFVRSLEDFSEVARLFPTRHKTSDLQPDSTRNIDLAEVGYSELMKTTEGTPEYSQALGNFILRLFPDCSSPTTVVPILHRSESAPSDSV